MLQLPPHLLLALLPLLVAIGLTMAIPRANVTNMFLARGLARQRDRDPPLAGREPRARDPAAADRRTRSGLRSGSPRTGSRARCVGGRLGGDGHNDAPAAHVMLEMLTPDLSLDGRVFSFVTMLTSVTNVAPGIDSVRLYLPPRTADSAELFARGRGDPEATARHFEETWKRIAAPDESARLFDRAAAVLGYISRAGVHLAGFTAQRHRARADGVGHLRRDPIPREPATQGRRDPDCARSESGYCRPVGRRAVRTIDRNRNGGRPGAGDGCLETDVVADTDGRPDGPGRLRDPAIVAGAAVLASIGPALRAMRVDPVVPLKAE
jgi:hypothetical protein